MRNRLLRFATYVAVGVVTGLIVAAVAELSEKVLLERVLHLPPWQRMIAPALGLWGAVLLLRWADAGRRLAPSTSEEYIRAFHDRNHPMRFRDLPTRLLAGIVTVGSGGAVGLEGPSIYAGATAGNAMQRVVRRLFRGREGYALLVAGAAAGVSAIFQAPATGVLFALEAPYKSDLGRRALLPALLSSAASYVVYVLVTDFDDRPFEIGTELVSVQFGRQELLGAAVVGALCGLLASAFCRVLSLAKRIHASDRPWWLIALSAGGILVGLAALCEVLFDAPLSLGPTAEGQLTDWALNPEASLWLLGVLLVIRIVATSTVLAGGGVGGVFIPLAVFGLIVGRLVGGWIELGPESLAFFPFIGVAAFLAAGYRTPLAAVMFVAESTGAPLFVVPALVAVAVSQVLIGNASVSQYQRDSRTGHLERRLEMPVNSAMSTEVPTVNADAPLADFVWGVALPRKQLEAIVVGPAQDFLGVIRLSDTRDVDRNDWMSVTCGEVMTTDITPARPSWTLREVTEAMADADIELYPVIDSGGRIAGVVTENAIVKLVDFLNETQGDR
ncbi:chloride channel protein [Candidatus Poriferisodalis sp.]|uniref:chloride channel protein n=1 Tax=Candidatus Poriferisodalis sp. TaxID=3101277 RepID=UPI003B0149D0